MSIGERLKHARKKRGLSQDELAKSIDVSRGVITNIEYSKVKEPQTIIVDAVCQSLKINKEWFIHGTGEMDDTREASKSAKILAELYDVAKDLSEEEQLYLLDATKALKARLSGKPDGC